MTILLTGGSASGKSHYGGALAARLPAPRCLVDTARPDPFDAARPLWRARMAAEGFDVIRRDTALSALRLPARGTVLLECMCHLLANEMFDGRGGCREAYDAVMSGVQALAAQCEALIVVTNEIGCGAERHDGNTRRYVEALGRINASLAADFDHVYELVCGIAIPRKGMLI